MRTRLSWYCIWLSSDFFRKPQHFSSRICFNLSYSLNSLSTSFQNLLPLFTSLPLSSYRLFLFYLYIIFLICLNNKVINCFVYFLDELFFVLIQNLLYLRIWKDFIKINFSARLCSTVPWATKTRIEINWLRSVPVCYIC
jgi:hypothetical protein